MSAAAASSAAVAAPPSFAFGAAAGAAAGVGAALMSTPGVPTSAAPAGGRPGAALGDSGAPAVGTQEAAQSRVDKPEGMCTPVPAMHCLTRWQKSAMCALGWQAFWHGRLMPAIVRCVGMSTCQLEGEIVVLSLANAVLCSYICTAEFQPSISHLSFCICPSLLQAFSLRCAGVRLREGSNNALACVNARVLHVPALYPALKPSSRLLQAHRPPVRRLRLAGELHFWRRMRRLRGRCRRPCRARSKRPRVRPRS